MSPWAKSQVLIGLHSFLETLEENLFSCQSIFYGLCSAHNPNPNPNPWLMAAFIPWKPAMASQVFYIASIQHQLSFPLSRITSVMILGHLDNPWWSPHLKILKKAPFAWDIIYSQVLGKLGHYCLTMSSSSSPTQSFIVLLLLILFSHSKSLIFLLLCIYVVIFLIV